MHLGNFQETQHEGPYLKTSEDKFNKWINVIYGTFKTKDNYIKAIHNTNIDKTDLKKTSLMHFHHKDHHKDYKSVADVA